MSKNTDRLSVSAVTASVLLFQAEHKLPDPVLFRVTLANGIMGLDFDTAVNLGAWIAALDAAEMSSQPYSNDAEPKTLHNSYTKRWGWSLHLSALVPVAVVPASSLPADTLAKLAEVAA